MAHLNQSNLRGVPSREGPEFPETHIPILKQATNNERGTGRVNQETSNKNAIKIYESKEEKRINEEKIQLMDEKGRSWHKIAI